MMCSVEFIDMRPDLFKYILNGDFTVIHVC